MIWDLDKEPSKDAVVDEAAEVSVQSGLDL